MTEGVNPIAYIRKLNGLTQRKLAVRIGCHYQTVYMAEHGLLVPLAPRVRDWASEASDYSFQDIERVYRWSQRMHRVMASARHVLVNLTIDSLGVPGSNPVKSLREFLQLSQSAFCKEFCIPVAWIYVAETGNSLPNRLRSVLGDIGVPEDVLAEMKERYGVINGL